jgi:hypothetical protein
MIPHKVKLAFVLGLGLLVARTSGAQEVPGGGPLQLSLTQVRGSPRLRFRVELHNNGKLPLTLNLGFTMSGKQYPDAIHLLLTDGHGKLLLLDRKPPGIMGSLVEALVVPLPAGATFALPIDLEDYGASKEKVVVLDLSPGQYTLRAEYIARKGTDGKPYWTGTVDSNTLAFTLAQEVAGQYGHRSRFDPSRKTTIRHFPTLRLYGAARSPQTDARLL